MFSENFKQGILSQNLKDRESTESNHQQSLQDLLRKQNQQSQNANKIRFSSYGDVPIKGKTKDSEED